MHRKSPYLLLLSIIALFLAGCTPTGTPLSPGSSPSVLPPTQSVLPTALSPTPTPISPAATSTPLPTSPTATSSSTEVIQHFPAGQDFTVTTIDMVDSSKGWAIGGFGSVGDHILTTSDGGSTWKDVTPPQPLTADNSQQVADAFFHDANTAWVTYGFNVGYPVPTQPVIWRTTDGGADWTASQPLDVTNLAEIYSPSNLQFATDQAGWLLVHVGVGMMHDYVVIYRTSDGGSTWQRILDPFTDGGIQSCSKSAMLFTDPTHGWLTGDCQGVKAGVLLFNSTDGGSTWAEVTLPDPQDSAGLFTDMNNACGSYSPYFFSNDLGYLSVQCTDYTSQQAVKHYFFYSTQDGGKTWSGASYPGASIYFFSKDTGWALATKIQLTTDGGKTWKPISDVTWSPQMDFISEQIGWAVARSPSAIALVKSVDGGATWSEVLPSVGQ